VPTVDLVRIAAGAVEADRLAPVRRERERGPLPRVTRDAVRGRVGVDPGDGPVQCHCPLEGRRLAVDDRDEHRGMLARSRSGNGDETGEDRQEETPHGPSLVRSTGGDKGPVRYISAQMQHVLVLNASYEPLNVTTVRRAHV